MLLDTDFLLRLVTNLRHRNAGSVNPFAKQLHRECEMESLLKQESMSSTHTFRLTLWLDGRKCANAQRICTRLRNSLVFTQASVLVAVENQPDLCGLRRNGLCSSLYHREMQDSFFCCICKCR